MSKKTKKENSGQKQSSPKPKNDSVVPVDDDFPEMTKTTETPPINKQGKPERPETFVSIAQGIVMFSGKLDQWKGEVFGVMANLDKQVSELVKENLELKLKLSKFE